MSSVIECDVCGGNCGRRQANPQSHESVECKQIHDKYTWTLDICKACIAKADRASSVDVIRLALRQMGGRSTDTTLIRNELP